MSGWKSSTSAAASLRVPGAGSATPADAQEMFRWMEAHREFVPATEWRSDTRGRETEVSARIDLPSVHIPSA
jgi:hypothetical protein